MSAQIRSRSALMPDFPFSIWEILGRSVPMVAARLLGVTPTSSRILRNSIPRRCWRTVGDKRGGMTLFSGSRLASMLPVKCAARAGP
ncbi:hypothetical protein GCM10010519_51510 [Streptomyces lactacystinicus]